MMNKVYWSLIISLCFSLPLMHGQMWNGVDTLYGNEWINYGQQYVKVTIEEDGIYHLTQSALQDAGVPAGTIEGENYQIFHLGEEIPIYTSTSGVFGNNDYIAFFGQKNRSEIDQFLYKTPEDELLNTDYSLFSDESAYYLTWSDDGLPHQRFDNLNNNLTNLPSAESFYLHESVQLFTSNFTKSTNGGSIGRSTFDNGEGFASAWSNSHTITLPTSERHSSGNANLQIRYASDYHAHDVRINFNNSNVLSLSFGGHRANEYNGTFSINEIEDDNEVEVIGDLGNTDRYAIAFAKLTYPRKFNFNNENKFLFTVPASGSDIYLEIENFNTGGQDPVLYDLTNQLRVVTDVNSGQVRVRLPSSSEDRQLILVNTVNGITPEEAEAVDFPDFSNTDSEFVIISHPSLMGGSNAVQDYANYRQSMAGGGYSTLVVDINDLYEQFAYGIPRHSISVRNFAHYIKKNWSNPSFLFIIGKGRELSKARTEEQLQQSTNETFYVPTFGLPGSDNLLVAGTHTNIPVIPISRIAVEDQETIREYLEKVETFESNVNLPQTAADRLWMKQLLHLGGGGNPSEQATIRAHLKSMENTIENNKFGGDVTAFYKSSTDPIQIGESDEIFEKINEGVSIITFFGHSAVGTFDFNIDNPERYRNFGKYPLLLSLGCYSGNIHTSSQGISERFIFLEDKGAIAFGASTGLGLPSTLRAFAEKYYQLIGGEMYGSSIGEVLQATIANFDNNQGLYYATLLQQFTLHGDPALRLNPQPGPDYTVGIESVSFEPSVVTTQLDSFEINFAVSNLGHNFSDSIIVEVEQRLPSGDQILVSREKIATPAFQKELSYTVASFGQASAGLNKFFIRVDTEEKVEELPDPAAELNNELKGNTGLPGIDLFIFDDSARPIFPENFGIVNESEVTLVASTANSLAPNTKYLIEIDTAETFNSSLKLSTEIEQVGGVVKWAPPINMQDSTVYYWRISPDSISAELGFIWEESSFIYLPDGSNGWNQSHFYQYKYNEFEGIILPEDQRFSFGENGFFITINNKRYDPNTPPAFIYNFESPAASVRPWLLPLTDGAVAVAVTDSLTGGGWPNQPGGEYGSINGGNQTYVFTFPTSTQEERNNLMVFLDEVIPENNIVYLFTVLKNFDDSFYPEDWAQDSVALGENIFSLLEAQGANLVRLLEDYGSVPYSIIYKKDGGVLDEDIALTSDDEIITEAFIPRNRVNGTLVSKIIGPAKDWTNLKWKLSELEALPVDTAYLSVYGLNAEMTETLLIPELITKDTMLDFIDAAEYPYLKLIYYASDETNRTVPQLDYWRVLYEGLPDAAVNSNGYFVFNRDTLQQGEPMQFEVQIDNVSPYDMDSLLVKYSIYDNANNEVITLQRKEPLTSDGNLTTRLEVDTRNRIGPHNLIMTVNPDGDQPERYIFNNYATTQFYIKGDIENPLLDVTFDGVHIMNGDIVSPRPNIVITLKDENEFLELSDTSLFKVFLKYPDATIAENIPMSSEWIRFYPASIGSSGEQNKAMIEFNPVFEEDGVYQLLVQAEDASGNQSGAVDFKVSFEVINRQAISNILNYPNPFSTSTQFVYTLTGEEIPEFFKIQIFTVSGRIVKEITQDDIGPLKIGTHRTEYRWDGTDEYGGKLANGVYLYRVVVQKANGESYDKFENSTSGFFRHDIGKMVILR